MSLLTLKKVSGTVIRMKIYLHGFKDFQESLVMAMTWLKALERKGIWRWSHGFESVYFLCQAIIAAH